MKIGTIGLEKHPALCPIHLVVLQLMKTLPYIEYQFTLFYDNLFGNPQLFSLLRTLGIGACGTTRKNVTKPIFGNIDNWNVEWGTLHLAIVATFPKQQEAIFKNESILVSLWQDSNKVGFCSIIYNNIK